MSAEIEMPARGKTVDDNEGNKSGSDSDAQGDGPKYEQQNLKFYLESEHSLEILNNRWMEFSLLTFLTYAFHLIMAIYAVNVFTDVRQNRACKEGQSADDAAAVYQTAIALSAIWHMIEWNRQALHFFSALVEVNMIQFYYLASINVIFGFVVCFVAIGTRYSAGGKECALAQETRANYLALHILFLILYLFTCFHHVLIFYIMGEEWCDEVINEEEEDDDD